MTAMTAMTSFDVQVVGAGIVGRSLALALARLGLQVALRREPAASAPFVLAAGADAAERGADVRAYALNAASVALLRGLKVWDALAGAGAATPVYEMHVEGDGAGRSGDGGAIDFSAWEQRVGELAWITDAAALERELAAATRFSPHISVVEGDVPAALTALCDGRDSAARTARGVDVERHDYGQRAVAARLVASRPHLGVARQWFRSPDVLALLPFDTPAPGCSYALVWSLPDASAHELLAPGDAGFESELNDATRGAAGELHLASARQSWPLTLSRTANWCGPGWALLGDAAHTVHPLAGQGLNLGLADVAALTAVIAAREPWRALGDEKLLRRYVRERAGPTWAMGEVTDGLLRAFSHDAPAARELRQRGMTLVNRLTPVKRWLTGRALDS